MKLRTFVIVSLVSLVLFFLTNYISARLPQSMPEEAVLGKQVWQKHNCVSCHTLFGNGGYVGDDLTHIVAKRSVKDLTNFFVNPPVERPNKVRRHPALTTEEAASLINYFRFVDTIPTLGWPPQAHKSREE